MSSSAPGAAEPLMPGTEVSSDVIVSQCKDFLLSPQPCDFSLIFDRMAADLGQDSPAHIACPGEERSFILLPQVSIAAGTGCTLTMWVCFDDVSCDSSITLCKCINSAGSGFELVFTDCKSHDQHFNVTLRTMVDGRIESTTHNENFILIPRKFHLVSLTMNLNRARPLESKGTVLLNDFKILESNSVKYPFSPEPSHFKWIFGAGLKGKISSMAYYDKDVGSKLLSLLTDLGPHMHSLDMGMTCPQSSFDTSINILGTLITKGEVAMECCTCIPKFCLTALPIANGLLRFSPRT